MEGGQNGRKIGSKWGGGRISHGGAGHILNPIPGPSCLIWAAQICGSNFACADPISPILKAGV